VETAKRFEDLWIWQEARKLVKEIYSDFGPASNGFKDFGFKDQIQRAGISIMNNISEGFERNSNAEFARYLDISKGSCGEVRSMYYAGEDLEYVTPETAENRRGRARQLAAGIVSLTSHLRSE
jgi:four helix bundle protein